MMNSHLLKRRGRLAVLTAVLWAAQSTAGETAGSWKCLPGEAPVKLSGFLDDTDLSGIAMAGSFALVASDENAGIQLGNIDAAGSVIQVAGGFLILSGSAAAGGSGREDSAFALSFVPSAGPGQLGQPVRIADVSAPSGKAEGLLVLEDSAERIRILVLHDGLPQGRAAAYTLLRPPAGSPP